MLRFATTGHLDTWRESETWRHLLAGAQSLIAEKSSIEIEVKETEPDGGVVEVIVTKVKAGREAAYRQWETKIQQAQSKFPGYCGSYVQPPLAGELGWTTLMRFDTAEHLDKWLKSPERVENAVAKHPSIVRVNPRRDPSKPCVCVGMTGLPVDERFENHKNGYKSPWVVRKYGVRLMPEASQASNENGTDRQAVTQTGTRRPANGARRKAATWTALVAW
jgi:heme-degrading monooxygenase HmoA